MSHRWLTIFLILIAVAAVAAPVKQDPNQPRQVFIGVFEGGDYVLHGEIREAYRAALEAILPDSIRAVFVPIGFKSAEWDREKSRQMARELAANKSIDLVLTLGPWTVEDLLAAGFDRPIVAAHRFDPVAESLVDKNGRPVVDNLTVQVSPQRLFNDIRALTSMTTVRRLGVLYFPTDGDSVAVAAQLESLGKQGGCEIVTARGYNVKGTYAFFRSFQSLSKKVDALYLGPLWGVETTAIREFFAQVQRERIPTFSADGRLMVERGALASVAAQNITMPARFAAWKTARIIEGAIPADLPTTLTAEISWSMNEAAALALGIRIPDNVRMHGYVVPASPDSEEVTLSIVDALERAGQQNTGYLATYDRIRVAAASAGLARSALLPELSADASLFYADDNTIANERDLSSNERAIGNLRLEWTPFSLEAIRAAQSVAKREQIARIDQTAANLDLAYAITAAFSAAYHAAQAVAARHDYLQAVAQAIEVATVRSTYETNDRFDLSRLQSEQYSAAVAFRHSEADRDIAQNLLNSLLGQPPDQPLRLSEQNLSEKEIAREIAGWQIVAPDKPTRNAIAGYLTKIAGESNPQMARSRTLADQKRLDIARSNAGRLPRLGFSARLSFVDSLANVAGFEEKHTVGRIGATLSLPIFFGNRGKRERDELKATISEIEYRRDHTRLDLARQISDHLLGLYARTYTIVTIAQAEPLASEHYDLAVVRFNKTPGTVNDLLDGARNLRDVRLSLLANVHAYLTAGATLLQLTGWSIGPNQITPGDALLTHLAAQFPVPEDER